MDEPQIDGRLWGLLAQHIGLSAAALALAIGIAMPLVLAMRRRAGWRWPVLGAASLVQTIPALALLALFYPALLGLKALTGWPVPALGFLPALLALTLYALLPILRGGLNGLTGIDPDVVEAARGIGMTDGERLRLVELPLAAPVLMAGVRTAAVWTIGLATLATAVGQPSLGDLIYAGLQTEDWSRVLTGCLAAAGLALTADALLGLVEAGLGRRDRRRIGAGLAGLAALGLAAALLAPGGGTAGERPLVVGAKNFSEQYILAELIAGRLGATGRRIEQRTGLGSAVAYRALAAGDLDVYVDYAGTLWTTVLRRADVPPRKVLLARLGPMLAARDGVRVLGPLGFENAYVLAVRRDTATRLGLKSIADLAVKAPGLVLGTDLEFASRPEWAALQRVYGLRFRTLRAHAPTFMYRALADGSADAITAFSSDGRIAAQDLVVLTDPKGAIASYDAVLLLSPRAARDARLLAALRPLIGTISVDRMRAANLSVDRDRDKLSPGAAAVVLGGASHLR